MQLFGFLEAAATQATTGETSPLAQYSSFIMIIVLVVVFYFFLYRPQKKQEKQIAAMRSNIKVGDGISTNGGILGKVVQIKDDYLIIETGNDKTKMKIAKWAIRAVEQPAEEDDE